MPAFSIALSVVFSYDVPLNRQQNESVRGEYINSHALL